jgi:hypothetical protein
MATPYNPLDKLNLGSSVAGALLKQPPMRLDDTANLIGAGVYVIYYTGPFPAYAPIAEANRAGDLSHPIYIGKAIPKGGRKGGVRTDIAATGRALRDRLRIHATSINETTNLELADFQYRCLVVDDIWIPLGENMLIESFRPVWNMVIDGFGNKTPGRRRADQYRSPWDVIHPGRKYVERLGLGVGPITAEQHLAKVTAFFAGSFVPTEPVETGDEDAADDE